MSDLNYVAVTAKDAIVLIGPGDSDGTVYLITYVEDTAEVVGYVRGLLDTEASWEEIEAYLATVPTIEDV